MIEDVYVQTVSSCIVLSCTVMGREKTAKHQGRLLPIIPTSHPPSQPKLSASVRFPPYSTFHSTKLLVTPETVEENSSTFGSCGDVLTPENQSGHGPFLRWFHPSSPIAHTHHSSPIITHHHPSGSFSFFVPLPSKRCSPTAHRFSSRPRLSLLWRIQGKSPRRTHHSNHRQRLLPSP
jgi:hypothetical protein